MLARFNWQLRLPSRTLSTHPGRGYRYGRILIIALTILFSLWLIYRYLVSPAWLASLPHVLLELSTLAEMAGGVTLALLWAVLWWYGRAHRAAPPVVRVDDLYALSPGDFERFVAELFRRKGYKVKLRGRSGDLGVDLEVTQPSGRRAVVQCKRYRSTVGSEVVRELFGTLIHERAVHGFLVTTADISDAAREWAYDKPLTLIDGATLVDIAAAMQARPVR